jgi:hypothetical protein
MNKRKRVADAKHRAKAKKYDERRKEARLNPPAAPAPRPAAPAPPRPAAPPPPRPAAAGPRPPAPQQGRPETPNPAPRAVEAAEGQPS